MRKLLIVSVAALSLSGCATSGGVGVTPISVANAIAQTCGIVIATATEIKLADAGNATFTGAAAIAEGVCRAWELSQQTPPAAITKRGVALYRVNVNVGGINVPVTFTGR